jgi:hypothetical protein
LPSAVRTVNSPEAMAASMAARSVVVNAMRQGCRFCCAKYQKSCTELMARLLRIDRAGKLIMAESVSGAG